MCHRAPQLYRPTLSSTNRASLLPPLRILIESSLELQARN